MYTLHFVSHTHWDREWYQTHETYRFRLVKLIDNLLDLLENDPKYQCFMLDGQTVILEDYLEVKPENKNRIIKFVKNQKIFIGPWYVLPDEFLISGETHIRNLMIGIDKCKDFGGMMKIGYLPDSFGHIAQIPQILKKSGINYSSFWRGAPKEVNITEFFWESPDGSRVLTLYMPFGYCTGANLPLQKKDLIVRIEKQIKRLSPYATTSNILFMNGCDHIEPDKNLPEKLETLQKNLPNIKIVHSNLPYIFREIKKESSEFPVFRGEWRSDEANKLLGGTLSTRIYLKQKHEAISSQIEREIEPLATLCFVNGQEYPEDIITHLWKLLLKNCPHDSICGCSIDPIHEEMLIRYRQMEDIIQKLRDGYHKTLAHIINSDFDDNLVVFNPHPFPVTSYLEADIYLEKSKSEEVDFSVLDRKKFNITKKPFLSSIELLSEKENVRSIIKEKQWIELLETPPNNLPEIYQAQYYKIGFIASNLPPMGFRIYKIVKKENVRENESIEQNKDIIELENEFYKINIQKYGNITLTDNKSNTSFPLNLVFEDGADAGDEYDYSPCLNDNIKKSNQCPISIRLIEKNFLKQVAEINYEMQIPISLNEDRKNRSSLKTSLPIKVLITIYPKVNRVDFDVYVKNSASDHRLRILFYNPIQAKKSYADGHFAIIERDIKPGKTGHQYNFVMVHNDKERFMVMTKGLPEYEILNHETGSTIAITLLRCVGWLSREDLLTRNGHGGWTLQTPGAQCHGDFHFKLGISYDGEENYADNSASTIAKVFNTPPIPIQVGHGNGQIRSEWSFVTYDNKNIVLSALKKAQGKNVVIIRLYNISSENQDVTLSFSMPLYLVKEITPIEEEISSQLVTGNELNVSFKPFEIKTWSIIFVN